MHLKGTRTVRVSQVPVASSSLNEGDVFILDTGKQLYQWNGPQCSRQEKSKGFDVARRIKDEERQGRCDYFLIDGSEKEPEEQFWKLLGGKPAKLKSAAEGGEDTKSDEDSIFYLYQISDSSGKLQITEAGRTPLKKDMLQSDDVFILDADSEIYVWIGKGATNQERKESMIYASKYLKEKNKPHTTPIVRIVEGGETPIFKSKFKVWPQPMVVKGQSGNKVAKVEQKKIDAKALHKQVRPTDEATVDDGSGNSVTGTLFLHIH